MRLWSRRAAPIDMDFYARHLRSLRLAEACLYDAQDLLALGWPEQARRYAEHAGSLLAQAVGGALLGDMALIERQITASIAQVQAHADGLPVDERPATLLVEVPNALAVRLLGAARSLPPSASIAVETLVGLAIFCHAALTRHDTARSMAGLRELRRVVVEAERAGQPHAPLLGVARDLVCGAEARGRATLDAFLAGPLRQALERALGPHAVGPDGSCDRRRLEAALRVLVGEGADPAALAAAARSVDRRLGDLPLAHSERLVAAQLGGEARGSQRRAAG